MTVYTEGGDTLYVMDQISDKKNKEDNWVESIALEESMKCLDEREKHIVHLRFLRAVPRWRWRMKSASPRLR